MALIHADGFAHYGTRENLNLFYEVDPSVNFQLEFVNNPLILDRICMRMQRFARVEYILPVVKTQLFCGLRFRIANLPAADDGTTWRMLAIGERGNNPQVFVGVNNLGGITLYQSGSTFFPARIASTGNGIISTGTMYYLEVEYSFTGTEFARVYLNGDLILDYVGPLQPPSASKVGIATYYASNIPSDIFVADFYVADYSGASQNSRFGDVAMLTVFPDDDLIEQDWTPSIGTDGFQMLNNATPIDTDYIQGSNVGDVSEFTVTDLPPTVGAIYGAVLFNRGLKDTAGDAKFFSSMVGAIGGVASSPEFSLNTSSDYFSAPIQSHPDGGIFTRANFNAMKFAVTRSL